MSSVDQDSGDRGSDEVLRLLADKQELTDLVYRACRAVDRADGDLLLSCYWLDAVDDHGSYKGGPAGLLEHLRKRVMDPTFGPVQHSITNLLIHVDGDIAYGEAYGEGRIPRKEGGADRSLARYVDRYERRNGEWRIIHRRVILESARPGFDTSDFAQGSRDRSDPSYERIAAAASGTA